MPYPESCPECGGAFRNTGTHYTARRNEVGRHVLLELGCQNTSRRYWWDFTSGTATEDGTTPGRKSTAAEHSNGLLHAETNGHATLAMLDRPQPSNADASSYERPQPPIVNGRGYERPQIPAVTGSHQDRRQDPNMNGNHQERPSTPAVNGIHQVEEPPTQVPDTKPENPAAQMDALTKLTFELPRVEPKPLDAPAPSNTSPALKDAFVRQLQLDRLTLRQMRSWLMSDEARRAIEVAAGATEAAYERLALILFGIDLPQLLGKQAAPPPTPGMSAEERLELQREKARIRARLRRAAAKAAREQSGA